MGRHARRAAVGADHPAVAQLRPGRGEVVLGWGSRGGAPRRPRQPESAAADRGEPPGDCRPARHADCRTPREVRQQRRRRRVSWPAADSLGAMVAAERLRSSRAARGSAESRARSPCAGRCAGAVRRRPGSAGGGFRRRGAAGGVGRLPVHRRQGMPRLPRARAARRARAAGPLRRPGAREPHALHAQRHRGGARRGSRLD